MHLEAPAIPGNEATIIRHKDCRLDRQRTPNTLAIQPNGKTGLVWAQVTVTSEWLDYSGFSDAERLGHIINGLQQSRAEEAPCRISVAAAASSSTTTAAITSTATYSLVTKELKAAAKADKGKAAKLADKDKKEQAKLKKMGKH